MTELSNDHNLVPYSFEKTYDFSVEVPIIDENTWKETGETEMISGTILFFGDADWDSIDEKYEYSFVWKDSTDRFSHDGNAPDKEDEFIQDFKEYLLQQGVEETYIGW